MLLWRIADVFLMMHGLRHNVWADGPILGKITAQFPDNEGSFKREPAADEVAVILLGARSNQYVTPPSIIFYIYEIETRH